MGRDGIQVEGHKWRLRNISASCWLAYVAVYPLCIEYRNLGRAAFRLCLQTNSDGLRLKSNALVPSSF